ncbi:AMP-binding protein, partial [Azospirillum sp. A39]
LQRCTGQRTVVCGATTSGRPAERPGVERQVGLFINTLPLAAAPDPALAVGAWLAAVQDLNLAMREHEQAPLAEIQRWLGRGGQALFDTLLVFENYPVAEAFRRHALAVRDAASHEQSNYALMVEVTAGETLRLTYHHDRARLGTAAVRRLDGWLRRLLEAMAQDAARPLGALALLAPAERAAALAQGVEGAPAARPELLLPEAFVRRARLAPEAVAVEQGGRRLSYGELEARSGRLAARLRAAGVGPDRLVAVALERTPELLVALLGVLRAGGAYVPLDPSFPAERLGYMLEDSGAALLLTQTSLRAGLPAPAAGTAVWCLDEAAEDAPVPESVPAAPLSAEHLAYVIYTSGSTGRPKGVAVRHGSLATFLASMAREPGLGPADRVLGLTSLSFDIAALELYGPLVSGGTVVLVDRAAARDPALLWAAIAGHGVTAVQATPSTWRMLGEA